MKLIDTLRKLLAAAMVALFGVTAGAQPATAPAGEPTTAAEAALQDKYGDKVTLEDYRTYRRIVDALPPEQLAWEMVLEDQLGGFYFPIHLKSRIKPDFNAFTSDWGYIVDDPDLPRILLIGDSISRSYTVSVRKLLEGKANLHRAPANCGSTDSGIKNMAVWLDQSGTQWDIVYFNFGIHDRKKTPEQYAANLEKVIELLQPTGAKLIFARTTPFRVKDEGDEDGAPPLNATSDAVMAAHGIPVDDLHGIVLEQIETLQGEDRTHFNAEGIKLLAAHVAATLEASMAEMEAAEQPQ